jgi:dolichol-phosphate mannosyltransferase
VLQGLDIAAEVILVDDGSSDESAELMREFAKADRRYKAIILSRNYGHQIALTAGLDLASGDAVVVLDADLQDPPELIPKMLANWRAGYQVVYGVRTARHGETALKKLTARLFYSLIVHLSGVQIPRHTGDFRLMDRKVADALRRMPEQKRFLRGMVSWAGFRSCPLPFERPPRAAGVTKYPWRKMFQFALDAIFSFSIIPLRVSTYLGLAATALAVFLILRALYMRFIENATMPGFAALYVAIWLLGGLNLFFMGILGEYIGRIYLEVKRRPLYLVQEYVSNTEGERDVQPEKLDAYCARSSAS